MKSIRVFVCFAIVLFCLVSCNVRSDDYAAGGTSHDASAASSDPTQQENRSINVSDAGKQVLSNLKINSATDVSILYFTDAWILYTTEKGVNPEDDTADEEIFYYDMNTQQARSITTIDHQKHASGSVIERKGKVYYPYTTVENNVFKDYILEIDLKNLSTNLLPYPAELSVISCLLDVDDGILLSNQIETATGVDYVVQLIDVDATNQIQTILKTSYDDHTGSGEVIMGIDWDQSSLYCFMYTIVSDHVTNYRIREYTLDGNVKREYDLDLFSFLKPSQGGMEADDGDAVLQLGKIGDYFILHTLNNRNLIFKKVNDSLEQVDIPESLASFDAGATFMGRIGNSKPYGYFYTTDESYQLFIFDSDDGSFSSLYLQSDQGILGWSINDPNGNLIVPVQLDPDSAEYVYYFLPQGVINPTIHHT